MIIKLPEIEKILIDIKNLLVILVRPKRPGSLKIFNLKEENNMLLFDVALPDLEAGNDVVSRELTVVIAGGEPSVISVPKDQKVVTGLQCKQDSQVDLSLVDVDDAGNRSPASTFSDVIKDTFPPAQPGALGVNVTGEIADP